MSQVRAPAGQKRAQRINDVRTRIEMSPKLPFREMHFTVHPPAPGWALGAISGVAAAANGTIYVIQRGSNADPVIALDQTNLDRVRDMELAGTVFPASFITVERFLLAERIQLPVALGVEYRRYTERTNPRR